MEIMNELLNAELDFNSKISLNEEGMPVREKWEYTSVFRGSSLVSSEPITGEELQRMKERIQSIINKW